MASWVGNTVTQSLLALGLMLYYHYCVLKRGFAPTCITDPQCTINLSWAPKYDKKNMVLDVQQIFIWEKCSSSSRKQQ
jgi:hypothetical protein